MNTIGEYINGTSLFVHTGCSVLSESNHKSECKLTIIHVYQILAIILFLNANFLDP